VDFNEEIDIFLDNDATALQMVLYYFYRLPWIIMLTHPVAVLLSTVFSLGKMSRNNELTAFIASGTPLIRLAVPILLSSFIISALSIGLNEMVVPPSNHEAERIMKQDIKKEKSRNTARSKKDLFYQGEDGVTYYAEMYDVKLKAFNNLVVQQYKGSHLSKRIDADKGFWNGSEWVLLKGAVRTFSESGEKTEEFTRKTPKWLRVKPDDLTKEQLEPEEMNYFQLSDYIDKIRRQGGNTNRYEVDLHFKFSFPLTSFLFSVIGISFSSGSRKPSIATGFGLTLLVSFTYYGILRIGQALGQSGLIPPVISAWGVNIIFCVLGGMLLYRANR
jgi:lipopolysaccharide export system permease protein